MDSVTPKQEQKTTFLTSDEYDDAAEEANTQNIEVNDWNETMEQIAQPGTLLRIPSNNEVTRKDVVKAFTNAFELIGGVPRLAIWANANPSTFYKLYARLLPSQASSALGESNTMTIRHVLPRGPLDE